MTLAGYLKMGTNSLNLITGDDDLPARISIFDRAVDNDFLQNKTGKLTLNVYLISMTDIQSTCSNHGKIAFLITWLRPRNYVRKELFLLI